MGQLLPGLWGGHAAPSEPGVMLRDGTRKGAVVADAAHTARAMWTLFEPVHAVIYFAPEARGAFEDAGLRGFWRGSGRPDPRW